MKKFLVLLAALALTFSVVACKKDNAPGGDNKAPTTRQAVKAPEAKKPEAKKPEAPKADAKKADAPKADDKKADAPKADDKKAADK